MREKLRRLDATDSVASKWGVEWAEDPNSNSGYEYFKIINSGYYEYFKNINSSYY